MDINEFIYKHICDIKFHPQNSQPPSMRLIQFAEPLTVSSEIQFSED